MKATFKISLRADYKNSNGESPINLRYIAYRKKKLISLNLFVNPDNWNEIKNEVSKKDIDYIKKNQSIENYSIRAKNIIHKASLNNKVLTTFEFENAFKQEKTSINSFFEFAEKEMEYLRSEFSKATIDYSYKSQISKLKKFNPNFALSDIDLNFIRKYQTYMIEKLKNEDSTAYKCQKWLKSMLNKAITQGLIKENPYKDFPIKSFEGHREFLSKEELKRLLELYKSNTLNPYKQNVLKYFLFSCYTGLRFTDMKNLKYKNIIEIETGRAISIVMHKTQEKIVIPLLDVPSSFISTGLENQKVFNVLTNQPTNRYLKEIMTTAHINRNITFHCARHSLATIGLQEGIPITTISKILGHKELKTTMIYAKVQPEMMYDSLKLFDNI